MSAPIASARAVRANGVTAQPMAPRSGSAPGDIAALQ